METIVWTKTLSILLSWAVHLSPYDAPAENPTLMCVDHQFMVDRACNGRQCALDGWYENDGVIYISSKNKMCDVDTWGADGLYVHEFIHYLQDLASGVKDYPCEEKVRREREAYEVQSRYMMGVRGALTPVMPPTMSCSN